MFLINPYILQSGSSLWDGLLAYYTADNTPNAATGNGNDLILANGATYSVGKIGNAFDYDGVNDFSYSFSDIGITGDFSYSCWLYNRDTSIGGVFTSLNAFTFSNNSFGISLTNTELRIDAKSSTGTAYVQYSGTVLPLNTWNFITVTWNETTKRAKRYANGVLVSDETVLFTDCTSADFVNGFRQGIRLNGQALNAKQDEIPIHGRIITIAEHIELYNSSTGITYTP